jgi:cell division protein FtsB
VPPFDDPNPNESRAAGRRWSYAVLFAACVLLANGIFGERGLMEMRRSRQALEEANANLARLRQENAALRETARRLRDDPKTIEAVARAELGLLKRGEILVTVRDAR